MPKKLLMKREFSNEELHALLAESLERRAFYKAKVFRGALVTEIVWRVDPAGAYVRAIVELYDETPGTDNGAAS